MVDTLKIKKKKPACALSYGEAKEAKMTGENLERILDLADKAYDEKRYSDSIDLLTIFLYESRGVKPELTSRAQARMGWNLYYTGLQENPRRAEGVIENPDNLKEAVKVWQNVLERESQSSKIRLSVLNGLPLAVRFFDREAAHQWSRQGIQEAEATGDDSLVIKAKNIRIILLREDGEYAEAKLLAKEVCAAAIRLKDFRTAGHANQNCADTIRLEVKNTQKTKAEKGYLLVKAYCDYRIAERQYREFETETGQKATAHIEAVQRKAEECLKEIKNLEQN
ncbi:MAG: hypothetical protein COT36_03310 [Parcubacteria group bacterium CG08_land_8_20_14_0_20_38_56]|nr:MAG: hypothetical protein COT36_03310 [Parcubacteria group bacterium CG08_land_8_20_14_0_20_38_56]